MFYGLISLNECDLYYDQIISEGANIEITKKLNTFRNNFNHYMQEARKYIKDKDGRKAKYNIQLARKELEGFKNEVKNMNSDVGSVVCGYMAHCAVEFGKKIPFLLGTKVLGAIANKALPKSAPSNSNNNNNQAGSNTKTQQTAESTVTNEAVIDTILMVGGKAFNLVRWYLAIKSQVENAVKIINSLKAGDKTEDALNMYRHDIIDIINSYEKSLDNLESKIKE
jgi:hypothetical protein